MDFNSTENLKIELVEEGKEYDLWVVYHPELGFPTYGIVNRRYGVIEMLQPNLHSARQIMGEFESWLASPEENSSQAQQALADALVPEGTPNGQG